MRRKEIPIKEENSVMDDLFKEFFENNDQFDNFTIKCIKRRSLKASIIGEEDTATHDLSNISYLEMNLITLKKSIKK